MAAERVNFFSSGARLAGTLTLPAKADQPGPAVVLAHGYANDRSEFGGFDALAAAFVAEGYVVLQFDFRGCGESDSPAGRMLCATEWPLDLISAISYLQTRSEVDARRIGLVGQSMGGGEVTYVSACDDRVACAVSLAGVGDGARWLHEVWTRRRDAAEWSAFLTALQGDRHARVLTGQSRYAPLSELLALDEQETANWSEMHTRYPHFRMEAPWESIDDVMRFQPVRLAQHSLPYPFHSRHRRSTGGLRTQCSHVRTSVHGLI
jgi:pimeloyl-ACP methyl ester carboxylesterase